jgi:hypothetical protein
MADFRTHAPLLAANFAPSLASSFRSHYLLHKQFPKSNPHAMLYCSQPEEYQNQTSECKGIVEKVMIVFSPPKSFRRCAREKKLPTQVGG